MPGHKRIYKCFTCHGEGFHDSNCEELRHSRNVYNKKNIEQLLRIPHWNEANEHEVRRLLRAYAATLVGDKKC